MTTADFSTVRTTFSAIEGLSLRPVERTLFGKTDRAHRGRRVRGGDFRRGFGNEPWHRRLAPGTVRAVEIWAVRCGGPTVRSMSIDIVPANEVLCEDLDLVFGVKGPAAECRCQRYRLARGESFANAPVEERADRLRAQTNCGDRNSVTTTGLVARLDGQAVGWCAVAPRGSHPGLVRNGGMAAWAGRNEDRTDPNVWAITCLFVRPGSRGHGVASALVATAVVFARDRGATRLEAYPINEHSAVGSEDHPGVVRMYEQAGFDVVHHPSKRRSVVEIRFPVTPRPTATER